MNDDKFSVWQYFANGDSEHVVWHVGAEQAVEVARRLCGSLGGRCGTTQRVRIVAELDDATVFEWQHGRGVVFPEQFEGWQAR